MYVYIPSYRYKIHKNALVTGYINFIKRFLSRIGIFKKNLVLWMYMKCGREILSKLQKYRNCHLYSTTFFIVIYFFKVIYSVIVISSYIKLRCV